MSDRTDVDVLRDRVADFLRAWDRKHRTSGLQTPPEVVFGMFSRAIDPNEVVESFFSQVPDDRMLHSGRAVLVTETSVFDFSWTGVPTYMPPGGSQIVGESSARVLRLDTVTGVEVVPQPVVRPPGVVSEGEIVVRAQHDWSVALPFTPIYGDGEFYLRHLLDVFGLTVPQEPAASRDR